MKHSKMNKSLVAALCTASLIVCSMFLQQTMAWDSIAYKAGLNAGEKSFSQEVDLDLRSAEEERFGKKIIERKTKFKKIFHKHLESRLSKVSDEKLVKMVETLDTYLNKVKDEKKLAQILALKELFSEEIDFRAEYELDEELLFLISEV